MIKRNKRAVSLMLSYVLLVVIAISLSIGVYSWLKFMAKGPEELKKCPETVSLVIQDYNCSGVNEIQVNIKNKGLFNVDGVSVKGTDNKSQEAWFKLKDVSEVGNMEVGEAYILQKSLKPNDVNSYKFSYEGLGKLEKIEIEPVRVKEEEVIFCNDATINQEINCL